MKVLTRSLILACLLGVLATSGWASPIVLNGSFEAVQIGSPFVSSNPADIPDWTHTGTVGDALLWAVGYADGGGSITTAGQGNQFVTMGGGVGGSGTGNWFQNVGGFAVGVQYVLSFMLAAETTGNTNQVVTAEVIDNATQQQSFTAPVPGANYWRNWQTFTLTFTANAATEEILFTSTTAQDVGLDNVSVSQAASGVPEPGTWGLLGTGVVVLALLRRRVK